MGKECGGEPVSVSGGEEKSEKKGMVRRKNVEGEERGLMGRKKKSGQNKEKDGG